MVNTIVLRHAVFSFLPLSGTVTSSYPVGISILPNSHSLLRRARGANMFSELLAANLCKNMLMTDSEMNGGSGEASAAHSKPRRLATAKANS